MLPAKRVHFQKCSFHTQITVKPPGNSFGLDSPLTPVKLVAISPPPLASPSHPEKPPGKPPEKQVDRAKVLFNYTAKESDELSITVREVLEVVSKDTEEGWWEVSGVCFERGYKCKVL